jgi:hypothetical protein
MSNNSHSNSNHDRTRNTDSNNNNKNNNNTINSTTLIIAYAVTVIDCQPDSLLLDNAVHLATKRRRRRRRRRHAKVTVASSSNASSSSSFSSSSSSSSLSSSTFRYDYQMNAFVYANGAQNCTNSLQRLGYTVQVHDVPIVISNISNPQLRQAILYAWMLWTQRITQIVQLPVTRSSNGGSFGFGLFGIATTGLFV